MNKFCRRRLRRRPRLLLLRPLRRLLLRRLRPHSMNCSRRTDYQKLAVRKGVDKDDVVAADVAASADVAVDFDD